MSAGARGGGGEEKSLFRALLLTLLFGPIGLFYASVIGGVLMTALAIGLGAATYGLGALAVWPLCWIWAIGAASAHNSRVNRR